MQVALIIPLSAESLPPGFGGLPTHPIAPPGGAGGPGAPGVWPSPPVPGQPLPGAPSRDELKAAIRAKLEEIIAGMNPPSRDEIRARLEQIADALRDKVIGALPPGCVATPK